MKQVTADAYGTSTSIFEVISFAFALAGCATGSKAISAEYVSPMQYQSYDCEQLVSEMQRVQVRVTRLGGRLDTAASNDKAIGVVGAVFFWPALFALGGTDQQEAEYAHLKGEYDAIQQSAIIQRCPGAVAPAQVPPTPNMDRGVEAQRRP